MKQKLKIRPALLAAMLIAPLFSSCDSKEIQEETAEPGWILQEDILIGTSFHTGKAYIRKHQQFGYEIFFSNGVATSTRDRLPQNTTEKTDATETIPSGMPPEMVPPAAMYQLFAESITPETDMEAFALAAGTPIAGRPVFSVDSMQGVMEYFWMLPDGWILGVITKDAVPFEKMLLKGAIPEIWR